MFKVSPASLQTFIDTPNCVLEDRVQYSTVHIPNVFCDGHLQIITCVDIIIVRCTETFLITLYMVRPYVLQFIYLHSSCSCSSVQAIKIHFFFQSLTLQSCANSSSSPPLNRSVATDNSICVNMQRFWKRSTYHRLRLCTVFLVTPVARKCQRTFTDLV